MPQPALLYAAYSLAHAPDLVRYGSKPTREIARDPELYPALRAALRSWATALTYPPNQAFIGNLRPETLFARPHPWSDHPVSEAQPIGPYGRIVDQAALYGLMKLSDDFDLLLLEENLAKAARSALEGQVNVSGNRLDKIKGVPLADVESAIRDRRGLPLTYQGGLAGFIRSAHDQDSSLGADVLLENLACKATAVLALSDALSRGPLQADQIDYLINTGEEAVGDRYQRGGGSLSKAVGEVVGCVNATGSDLKAFCSAPVHGLIVAAGLVSSGIFKNVVVLGGGSQAKLGMKFTSHLKMGIPIMEDMLASMAFVIGPANGHDPCFRLDVVGRHPIRAGSSPQELYQALVIEPLMHAGLKLTDVDRYAVELHNPEITLPAGSGDVPQTNYRTLAALAVLRKEIGREDINDFVLQHGLPGYVPTQGHIPAGVPYLGHARTAMLTGDLMRVMVVAKGSLFLGRMTQMADGVSFLIERPGVNGR